MANYRKILVAFDGSESSKNALRQAIVLRDLEKSWIKVLAVVPTYEGDLELVGVRDIKKVLQGPTEKLMVAAEEVARKESTEVITSVEQGEAYEKIVDVCDEENCDLIAMGRRGLLRIERILLGSVTARVIGHSTKDVFVVPRDVKLSLENILLPTDGSAHSEAALARALHFAGISKGRLTAVSVVDIYPEFYAEAPEVVEKMEKKAVEILDKVREKAEKAGVKLETKVLIGNAAEEIVGLANEIKAGVVFIGSRGRSGLKKIVMGSVAEKVIGLASCPVLVAKA
jgi:nucleotide-binding universal stress UspA family protein